ncbi:hypothetical protein LP419_28255 [Massilia sp. H-1]|nr:hypothetical protein LP419_28255 [Massilia sp. H-1]
MPLPIYHHPSLTVLIDDSDSFLRSLSFQLDPALASKSFHDTRSAIDWLDQQRSEAPAAAPCTRATTPTPTPTKSAISPSTSTRSTASASAASAS